MQAGGGASDTIAADRGTFSSFHALALSLSSPLSACRSLCLAIGVTVPDLVLVHCYFPFLPADRGKSREEGVFTLGRPVNRIFWSGTEGQLVMLTQICGGAGGGGSV
jgi:hypothetical protein